MRVKQSAKGNGYTVTFDKKYFRGRKTTCLPRLAIQERSDVTEWLDVSPELKQAMDRYFGKHRKNEREFQQILVRDNNFGGIARSTDYYICDIEYNAGSGKGKGKQFDMVAVHWPSERAARKKADDRRLVIIEMKHGDGALTGKAGLHPHIEDTNEYLSTPDDVKRLKEDMLAVFNQKRELALIDCGKDLRSFSDEKPLLLLAFANHAPGKSNLHKLLHSLPNSPHAELRIVTASLLGYGLYDQGIHTVESVLTRFSDYIYDKKG